MASDFSNGSFARRARAFRDGAPGHFERKLDDDGSFFSARELDILINEPPEITQESEIGKMKSRRGLVEDVQGAREGA